MEAIDTVMSEEQLEQVERKYLEEDFSVNAIRLNRGHTEDLRLRIVQAQAKISFPKGIDKGRKEVVDSEIHINFACGTYTIQKLLNMSNEGKIQLKEWGL